MTGIKIPVEAAFDKTGADRAVQDFQQQFNALGSTIAKLNKTRFNPIDKASIEDMRRLQAGLESLKKVSGDFNKRLKSTGQDKSDLFGIDWGKLYPDQHARARQMQKTFDYVSGGNRFGPGESGGSGGGRPPSGGGGGGGPPPAAPPGGGGGGHGRNIVGAGLNALGPAGGVANRALSTGMATGVGAGLGALAGGLAALAVGKLISKVAEKVGTAQQEYIGYDTLKRSLGDVNVSFNVLKESLREASRGLDMTFEEGQRLGVQFTKLSGISGEQYKQLAEEVNTAGGFGRSFGIDPSQSTAFFAQMRMYQVSQSSEDSRKLSLTIAESIAKSGSFSKADEVLEAIAGFTAQQTRIGMNRANVEGYASFFTGMVGSKIPGMDPASSAALLGRVNSSISSGGGAGEAGQNFMYTAIGQRLGLDPIQAAIMREQGAFGTGRSAFGQGSTWERFAGQNGLGTPDAANSDKTNLQLITEQLKKVYEGKPELMVNAMANLFGVNNSQAMALSTIDGAKLGGLASRLQKNGININDVNSTGISRLAQIEGDSTLSDTEKDRQIKEAATQNQETTEGSRTRATINGVERAIVTAASQMVPLMNDMRAGIMSLAGEGGKKSPLDIREAIMRADAKDRYGSTAADGQNAINASNSDYLRAKSEKEAFLRGNPAPGNGSTAEEKEAWQKKVGELTKAERDALERTNEIRERTNKALKDQSEMIDEDVRRMRQEQRVFNLAAHRDWAAGGAGAGRGSGYSSGVGNGGAAGAGSSGGSTPYDDIFDEAAKQYGLDPRILKTTALKENAALDPNAIGKNSNGTQDMGLMQHNSKYLDERGLGNGAWKDPRASIFAAAKLWRQNLDSSRGDVRTAARKYNGSGPAAESYANDWMSRYGAESSTPMPSVASAGNTGAQENFRSIELRGTFNLNGPNGQPAAAPVTVAVRTPRPNPSGAGGSW